MYSPLFSSAVSFSIYLVAPAIFISYLLSSPPTILWRDTPEFANVAFTLSIAHPAGFPIYSLLVKPLTFIPFGSIAFKTNLASAIFSLLTVVLLFATVRLLIKRVYPSAPSPDIQISAAAASLLFALGPIVWHNAISAEVYTLNTLFIAGLIYFILRWLDGFDPRWLYCSAFLYGLSVGNHATVALFLPGLLAVYFIYRQGRNFCQWIRAIFFFFLGLSVYLYLPVRSLVDPPLDWGHPRNLRNFLYQITDQKDFGPEGILAESNGTFPFYFIFNHFGLISDQFSPVGIVLVLLGVVLALRRERGLGILLLWILFSNHTFFWGWTSGDAFLPSYLALALFLGMGTFTLLSIARNWAQVTASRLREMVAIGLSGVIFLQLFFTYPKVNKRDYYLPADFFRPAFRSLDPGSLFLTDVQWLYVKYFRDIERLREDIFLLSVSELSHPRGFHYISSKRHPGLIIPPLQQGNPWVFVAELLTQNNQAGRPIFREITENLNQLMVFSILPHQDFILRAPIGPGHDLGPTQISSYAKGIEQKLLSIRAIKPTAYDADLYLYLNLYIVNLAIYLNDQGYQKEAISLLKLYLKIYGPEGARSISDKTISVLYNNVGSFEFGQGEISRGLKSWELAIQYDPKHAYPYVNLALWYLEKAPDHVEEILERARKNGLNPKVCDILSDHIQKRGEKDKFKQVQTICERNQEGK